jgi:hypothetical protein
MKRENLTEQLFEFILVRREVSTSEILTEKLFTKYTKQGIYKALRSLRDEEKILWSKRGKVEVHLLWIQKEIDRLAEALPEKELVFKRFTESPVTYSAPTLTELERLYGQIFISLISSLEGKVKNFLFYDVHNYTYVNTTMIVDWYIDYIRRSDGDIFLLVGSQSPLDEQLRKRNKMKEIHVFCIPPRWPVALSIFGEYIISIRFNKKILSAFEEIFATETMESAVLPLTNLYASKYPSKITIERNATKAAKLAKTFHKYFVIK